MGITGIGAIVLAALTVLAILRRVYLAWSWRRPIRTELPGRAAYRLAPRRRRPSGQAFWSGMAGLSLLAAAGMWQDATSGRAGSMPTEPAYVFAVLGIVCLVLAAISYFNEGSEALPANARPHEFNLALSATRERLRHIVKNAEELGWPDPIAVTLTVTNHGSPGRFRLMVDQVEDVDLSPSLARWQVGQDFELRGYGDSHAVRLARMALYPPMRVVPDPWETGSYAFEIVGQQPRMLQVPGATADNHEMPDHESVIAESTVLYIVLRAEELENDGVMRWRLGLGFQFEETGDPVPSSPWPHARPGTYKPRIIGPSLLPAIGTNRL